VVDVSEMEKSDREKLKSLFLGLYLLSSLLQLTSPPQPAES